MQRLNISGGYRVAVWAFVALAGTTAASAQFATCINRPLALGPNPNPNPALVHALNLTTGQSTQFFDPINGPQPIPATAVGFQGLAADEATRRLFAITTNGLRSDLYAISYGSAQATFIAQCRVDPAVDNTVANANGLVLTGLGFDSQRQRLIATLSLQSGTVGTPTFRPEGLYEVNVVTGQTTLVRTLEVLPASDFTIDGIDYDAASDTFYLADDDTTGGRNVYSLPGSDLTAPLTLVVAYPAGVTDVDGLGVGGGKILLVSDGAPQGNGGFHTVYDIASGTFDRTIATPYPSYAPSTLGPVNPSAGATYAPGLLTLAPPTCLADLVGGDGNPPADGSVDGNDFSAFLNAFGAGSLLGDLVGGDGNPPADGSVDGNDFSAFLNAFGAGC